MSKSTRTNAYTAQLTFNWRSEATTGKGTTAVALQPYGTRMVDVAALQTKGTIPASAQWAYVSITAPVKPDELLAVAASYDSTGRFGAQTPFSGQVSSHWEGGKWEVDANHDTIIAIGNAGSTATKAQITFHYNTGQGQYQVEKELGPDEQIWLDMGKVIGNQIQDKNGKSIPSDVMSGTYEFRNLNNLRTSGLFEGKLVVNKTYGYAAHGCSTCCAEVTPYMDLNPLNLLVGGSGDQSVWATNTCSSFDEDISGYYSSWGTDNTQIATANMSLMTGVAVGNTTNFANGLVPRPANQGADCPYRSSRPSAPVNVKPKILFSGNDITNTTQSVVTGQQIALSSSYSLPSGVTVTGQSWSLVSRF